MKNFGVIGRKLGMTSVFDSQGRIVPLTLVHVPENVTVKKMNNKLLLGAERAKSLNKPQSVMFDKAGIDPKNILKEFHVSDNLIDRESFTVSDFEGITYVDVRGISKGKGFAGPMKRHGFAGLRASHGVSKAHRSHGSTGQCQDPGRTFKGKKMAGHMGVDKVVQQNLKLYEIDKEKNILAIFGAIPGPKRGVVFVTTAIKHKQLQDLV